MISSGHDGVGVAGHDGVGVAGDVAGDDGREAGGADSHEPVPSTRFPVDDLSLGGLSYATLGSYATRHGISVDGPLREHYLRGADDTADQAEWRTEIGWPIFRAGGPRGAGG
jgi:hypothetical protein